MNTESNVCEKTKFQCETCGKYSKTQQNLILHIPTHTGEKPYDCIECGKAFSQIGNLNIHIRAFHTVEKNYHCDVCGKEFVTNAELKIHTRYHTGEKPYRCKVCGKTFTQRCNLNTHIRTIHSVVKPFECDVCEKTFADKSNLSTHIQKVRIKTSTNNIQNKGDSNESVMVQMNPSSSVNTFDDSNATSNYNCSELNRSPSNNYQAIIVPNEIQKDKNVLPHHNNVSLPNPFILQSEEQSSDAQTNNTF